MKSRLRKRLILDNSRTDTKQSRACDGCSACCIIYAVPELQKPTQTACRHICGQGCAIHSQPRPRCVRSSGVSGQCDWIGVRNCVQIGAASFMPRKCRLLTRPAK